MLRRRSSACSGGSRVEVAERRCLSFTLWGFTDRHSWVPGWFSNPPERLATVYDENYQPKRRTRSSRPT
ncbi:endo-1,4-beta-xylanase [Micromonospora sp. NPDC007271]|uniref:endo-1,4-beta-xylanase n=1 Tax=Micromonospora sp. NPDC007271 TaxID=3154587 RepID=UPI0033C6136A